MNIHSLLRELSGPRPLRRVMDIVSKPRIWSRSDGHFTRKPAVPPSYGVGKDCNLVYLNRTVRWRLPRRMIVQPHWRMRGGSFQKLRNKPRLVEPFYDGYIYF